MVGDLAGEVVGRQLIPVRQQVAAQMSAEEREEQVEPAVADEDPGGEEVEITAPAGLLEVHRERQYQGGGGVVGAGLAPEQARQGEQDCNAAH